MSLQNPTSWEDPSKQSKLFRVQRFQPQRRRSKGSRGAGSSSLGRRDGQGGSLMHCQVLLRAAAREAIARDVSGLRRQETYSKRQVK